MSKVIIRVAKLKTIGNIAASGHHTFRETPTPNADGDRTAMNILGGAENTLDLVNAVRGRLPDKHRKDAVLCLEYLVSASPEHFGDDWRERQNHGDSYFSDSLDWLKKKHGEENIVCSNVQLDEQTPHLVVYVVPRLADGRLSAKEFTGGKAKLQRLQTEFAQEVGQKHGLERGIEGSKARHVTIKEYYNRVNSAFSPLPEVTTPAPAKLAAAPEKPGLFSGPERRGELQREQAKWDAQHAKWEAQNRQHMAEVKAQLDAAVETAKRHEAQAREAAALKADVAKLKQSNATLGNEVRNLRAVAQLFTPDEIRAAQIRQQQQQAEKVRLDELARSKAAELARVAGIEAEAAKRVQDIPNLLRRAGAAHCFGMLAREAMMEAHGDPLRIDWKGLERRAIEEAIGRHGQSPENVATALLAHSPARADPATHPHLLETIKNNSHRLEEKYEQDRADRDRGNNYRPD